MRSLRYGKGPCAYEKVGSCVHTDQVWYIKYGDYKDRQLEVRLGGSCARARRRDPNEILGGGLAKTTIHKSNRPQIVDHAFVRKYCSSRRGSYWNTVPGNVIRGCHTRPTREQGAPDRTAEEQSHLGLVTEDRLANKILQRVSYRREA